MSVAPGSCVACGAAFRLNRQLATIPDASRIAFDPARHRVWRICESCGEWNLLGTEAAGRAMPELVARFEAAPKRAGSSGVAPAHVGETLELLQIGDAVVAASDVAVLRRSRRLQRLKWLGGAGLVVCAFGLVGDAFLSWHWGVLSNLVLRLLTIAPLTWIGYSANRLRHHLPVKFGPLLPSVAIIVAAEVILARNDRFWYVHVIWFGLCYGVIPLLLPPISRLTVRLPGDRVLRLFSMDAVRRISISWDATSAIELHGVPEGGTLTGSDALFTLRHVLKGRNLVYVRRSVSDAASDLVRTVGGLSGVLRALEGFRQDAGGRVVVADLPKVYILALDLALAGREEAPRSLDGLGRRAVAAATVAREAEALDVTLNGGG